MLKNIILLGALLFAFTYSFGQWSNIAPAPNVVTTGKVGIGTSSTPTYPITIVGANGNTSKIGIYDNLYSTQVYGIGVQSNQFRFNLGASAARYTFFDDPAGTNEIFNVYGTGGAKVNLIGTSSSFLLNNAAGNSLFKVNSYGAVLINIRGSESPYSTSFDIKSNHTVPPSFSMSSEVTNYGVAGIRIGIAQNSANACDQCYSDASKTNDVVISSLSSSSSSSNTLTGASLLLTNHTYMGSIKFTTKDIQGQAFNGDKQRMEIKYDGKVVIGQPSDFAAATTPYPNGYNLFVSKGILTEKVKIGNPAVDWSDFVFADEYKLRNLSDVEKYIKQNRHLPEIPSAAEVKVDGIDVAQMDALLLQKIEELTLYLIEMKKENERISQEVKDLKAGK